MIYEDAMERRFSSMQKMADKWGLSRKCVDLRLDKGMDIREALTTPRRVSGRMALPGAPKCSFKDRKRALRTLKRKFSWYQAHVVRKWTE